MQYNELVKAVKDSVQNAKASKTLGHIAFQFNIEGEAEGVFYLEISDGKIQVEPYDYYDRDVLIVTSADVLMQMLNGTIKARAAYTDGLLKAYGDVRQLDVLPFGCECKASGKGIAATTGTK